MSNDKTEQPPKEILIKDASSLLDITLRDLLKRLPTELIDSLVKVESMQRKRNIYIIDVDEASEEHGVVAKYEALSLEELPMKIITDNPIKGLFSHIQNKYKDKLGDPQFIEDVSVESVIIEKLYFQILRNPQQILADLENYVHSGDCNKYHYYYCFDNDSWLKNLIKRDKLIDFSKFQSN